MTYACHKMRLQNGDWGCQACKSVWHDSDTPPCELPDPLSLEPGGVNLVHPDTGVPLSAREKTEYFERQSIRQAVDALAERVGMLPDTFADFARLKGYEPSAGDRILIDLLDRRYRHGR